MMMPMVFCGMLDMCALTCVMLIEGEQACVLVCVEYLLMGCGMLWNVNCSLLEAGRYAVMCPIFVEEAWTSLLLCFYALYTTLMGCANGKRERFLRQKGVCSCLENRQGVEKHRVVCPLGRRYDIHDVYDVHDVRLFMVCSWGKIRYTGLCLFGFRCFLKRGLLREGLMVLQTLFLPILPCDRKPDLFWAVFVSVCMYIWL